MDNAPSDELIVLQGVFVLYSHIQRIPDIMQATEFSSQTTGKVGMQTGAFGRDPFNLISTQLMRYS